MKQAIITTATAVSTIGAVKVSPDSHRDLKDVRAFFEDNAHGTSFVQRGVCVDMCKEVGAYPKCPKCPEFVPPDSTPGVQTWEELLEHMDNLLAWKVENPLENWAKQNRQ